MENSLIHQSLQLMSRAMRNTIYGSNPIQFNISFSSLRDVIYHHTTGNYTDKIYTRFTESIKPFCTNSVSDLHTSDTEFYNPFIDSESNPYLESDVDIYN